jgi:hypothetical protein
MQDTELIRTLILILKSEKTLLELIDGKDEVLLEIDDRMGELEQLLEQ